MSQRETLPQSFQVKLKRSTLGWYPKQAKSATGIKHLKYLNYLNLGVIMRIMRIMRIGLNVYRLLVPLSRKFRT